MLDLHSHAQVTPPYWAGASAPSSDREEYPCRPTGGAGCITETVARATLQRYRDDFLCLAAAHHAAGDYYPDPRALSDEMGLCPRLADQMIGTLWAEHWIARSPYATERIRLTPRAWERVTMLAAAGA